MNTHQLSHIISKAKDICVRSGGRLTEKRKHVLERLLESNTPLSAYEITDAYNKVFEKPMPTMSVYRILEFLEAKSLAHKLSSTNKYVACSHILGGCSQEITQFLICGKCQSTKEIAVSKGIINELGKLLSKVGYTLTNSKLELQCLCNNCSASTA
ncbi:MAG: Fur family zinc uptake transcriptional regulator [Psychrobacter glaciei]|jgi:Fur family zinc uptake transcriptional regulator